MFTDDLLRVSGSHTAAAAAYANGAPSGFPAGQVVTANGDNLSTDTIDLGGTNITREIGEGKALYMVWSVTDAFVRAAGAIGTIFQILIDDDPALGTPVVIAATGSIAKADLHLGAQVVLQIPPVVASLGLRYLGANVNNANAPDAASVCCDIVETLQDGMKFYPAV